MQIVADNDVGGIVAALRLILESSSWRDYFDLLQLTFVEFDELGLLPTAPDHDVWATCQRVDAVLVTGNRSGGRHSLDEVIQEFGTESSLPVITLSDPRRIMRDRLYAEYAAAKLVDYLERIESLRGTGRLFIP